VADLPVLPMDSTKSGLSRKSGSVAEEGTVAPVTALPDNAPDPSALELEER